VLSHLFRRLSFGDLPGWREDDKSAAFDAFRRSALHCRDKPYRSGALGVAAGAFRDACQAALRHERLSPGDAEAFFEQHFVPFRIVPEEPAGGLLTGFYEPELQASAEPTERFRFPLLARPGDLVDLDDSTRPAGLDPYLAFGRRAGDTVVEYFDRREIECGALAGRGLELAWLESRIDAFFVHVQGAARLKMTDGSLRRVTYAAKSGQRFTGPGRVLAELGELDPDAVTMQSIRAWLAAHPDRVDEILWRNRSYIFFRFTEVGDVRLGPIAAAKVQLTPGRSIAVDRVLHTFGTPFYLDCPDLAVLDGRPLRRLLIAQDTGSAITGPARGDLFVGTGEAAGEVAGVIRKRAEFYMLVPSALAAGASS
jgi:membrane-bound lytic murein transglycosylase A